MSFQDQTRAAYDAALARIRAKVTTETVTPVAGVRHNDDSLDQKIVGVSFGPIPGYAARSEVRVHVEGAGIFSLNWADLRNSDPRFIIALAEKL